MGMNHASCNEYVFVKYSTNFPYLCAESVTFTTTASLKKSMRLMLYYAYPWETSCFTYRKKSSPSIQ